MTASEVISGESLIFFCKVPSVRVQVLTVNTISLPESHKGRIGRGRTCLPLQVMQCVEEFLLLRHRPPLPCSAAPPVVAGTAPQSGEGPFQTKLTCEYVHKHTEHFVVCSLMKAREGGGEYKVEKGVGSTR